MTTCISRQLSKSEGHKNPYKLVQKNSYSEMILLLLKNAGKKPKIKNKKPKRVCP